MAAIKNDGAVPYGSRQLTIATVAYVADNIEITRPSKKIERTNELDEPTGKVIVPNFVTGTCTLQLITAGSLPQMGAEFTSTFDSTVGAETFYISEIGQPEAKDQEKKVNVQFDKKYN